MKRLKVLYEKHNILLKYSVSQSHVNYFIAKNVWCVPSVLILPSLMLNSGTLSNFDLVE